MSEPDDDKLINVTSSGGQPCFTTVVKSAWIVCAFAGLKQNIKITN